MMDGGRLGPAVRAFRHSLPSPSSAFPETCWLPSAEPAEVAPGAERGRLPSRTPGRGVSGGEEGRAGRAEGPAAGWGQRRGQRSHWHAASEPPTSSAELAPSLQPKLPGMGLSRYLPAPVWGWEGGSAARWAGGAPPVRRCDGMWQPQG